MFRLITTLMDIPRSLLVMCAIPHIAALDLMNKADKYIAGLQNIVQRMEERTTPTKAPTQLGATEYIPDCAYGCGNKASFPCKGCDSPVCNQCSVFEELCEHCYIEVCKASTEQSPPPPKYGCDPGNN